MAVVHHTGVLIHIAHCLRSTKDVLSLLQALPRHALDAPLAALLTLLTTPETLRVVERSWPWASIEEYGHDDIATVFAALPIFRSVQINCLHAFWAASEPHRPATWGHEVEFIPSDGSISRNRNVSALLRLLRLCPNLHAIVVHIDRSDPALTASILQAAQHVKRIHFVTPDQTEYNCGNWRPLFAEWLASGHATHLGIIGLTCDDNVGFARAIAAATSLTSLQLAVASGVLQGLVDVATPLKAITKLRLAAPNDSMSLEPFVTNLIDLSALQVFDLSSDNELDLTFGLALLPRLGKLKELELTHCNLRAVPALPEAPAHLRLLDVSYSSMNDETCLGLLHWASQSPCLDTIWLKMCDTVSRKPVLFASYLRRWITGSVTFVALDRCELDEKSVIAIATALCDACRSSSTFSLRLDFGTLDVDAYDALFEALATCNGVKIEVIIVYSP
ncbi:hypothetical protein SDRG_07049 [Saprolegnia diclina VS20]|uniref:F-box domain-containing protein n=1 Tax=Saprolegnia diclina (strain VS20) TaxID=1156394 RepID=T0RY78_SAPDV|nr:hypothetical protein SDRG_07049 [Saprolegnia diclina VS20]EQC35337.1 hypothetical protein SDRG_07049 [Saprolegnia diclina VS20]|eukprot:XP_008611087.1 hypothetical protein SDRG_07049 [Saprolegnia diclina VS20]